MCGRFYIDDNTMFEIETIVKKIERKLAKVGTVYPTEPALVLCSDGYEIQGRTMKWGYENHKDNTRIINARSETVLERPLFRNDFEYRRCIIPATKFYEWKRLSSKDKEKYSFYVPDKTLYLAGIYRKTEAGEQFSIITKDADGAMLGIHHRMPVIIQEDKLAYYMESRKDAQLLMKESCKELERKTEEEFEQLSLFSNENR